MIGFAPAPMHAQDSLLKGNFFLCDVRHILYDDFLHAIFDGIFSQIIATDGFQRIGNDVQPIPDNLKIPGKSGLNLILAPDGSLNAYVRVKAIDVRIVPDLSMQKLVKDATEELAEGSVTLHNAWQQNPDPVIGQTPDLELALIAQGSVQSAAYEIHFGVVQRPPLIFCVTAIVIAMQTDAIASLRGRRVYKLALATARPR